MARDYETGYECERCGADTSIINGETTFISAVYHARICLRCKTAWDRFIRAHAVWSALVAIDSTIVMLPALTSADGQNRTDALADAGMQRNAILTEIADIAEAWMKAE